MFSLSENAISFFVQKGETMAFQDLITTFRKQAPLVQCIASYVAMNAAVNLVLPRPLSLPLSASPIR